MGTVAATATGMTALAQSVVRTTDDAAIHFYTWTLVFNYVKAIGN